jgi:16S rRNA C967 or C1407 C5-methylase (RsmB/RsmF family)
MAPEENEGVIDRVLRRARTPIELVDIGLPLVESRPGMTEWRGTTFAKDVGRAVRIIGSDTMTPFFMARIQRVD